MFIKLLTFSAIWIAFGFAAGSAIWFGMVVARKRARAQEAVSESLNNPAAGEGDGGTTYRVLKGGIEDTAAGGRAPARRGSGERELLNFPR